jgi:N-methylhydantoinase A
MTRRAVADERAADVLREVFAIMRARALARAAARGLNGRLRLSLTAEMRFIGQAFEVPVPFEEAELEVLDAAAVRRRFGEAHHRVYFFGGEAAKPIEFVSFRLGVVAPLDCLPLLAEEDAVATPPRPIRIFDGKAWQDAQLLRRHSLAQERTVPGPTLIEDPTSTLYVPRGWNARLDANHNTILERW